MVVLVLIGNETYDYAQRIVAQLHQPNRTGAYKIGQCGATKRSSEIGQRVGGLSSSSIARLEPLHVLH
jgi:hypothetical protein